MAWKLDGNYFENCSCEMPCPCTVTFDAGADYDRCHFLMAFRVNSGEVDGVDMAGRTVAVVGDTPKVMTEGNWKVGIVVDDDASEDQVQKLGAVFGGQMGGPMEVVSGLVGEVLGVEQAPIELSEQDGRHRITVGDATEMEVEDVVPFGAEGGSPAQLVGVGHPASDTLTVARSTSSRISLLGVEFATEGTSGFSAPFSWSG
jgi:hypothetical protein